GVRDPRLARPPRPPSERARAHAGRGPRPPGPGGAPARALPAPLPGPRPGLRRGGRERGPGARRSGRGRRRPGERGPAPRRRGRLACQGEASQLVTTLLALAPGDRLLDACAAPGGKAVQAAALLAGRGLVAALDRRPGGVRRVRDEALRLGAACVEAAVGDARRPPFARPFDAV